MAEGRRSSGAAAGPTVGVIGGGLAGLAAACAVADASYRVTVFERKPFLGGRAASYELPGTGEVVDNCQHILLGCCTNLTNFCERLGVSAKIRWYDRLTFLAPGGQQGSTAPSRLPAPFHAAPAFLGYPHLSLADKLSIARGMFALIEGIPGSDGDFLQWLRAHRQTERAIARFWSPVLVSALNEELSGVSVHYGAMVFRDAFLKSAAAGRLGVPTVPLSELYGEAAGYIAQRGGEVRLRCTVESFMPSTNGVTVRTAQGVHRFDYLISAVPFHMLSELLPPGAEAEALARSVAPLRTVPITGIRLWFDREITPLEHAVLLDRTIQWMFQKSKILSRTREDGPPSGSYLELVVSASRSLLEKPRAEIVELALRELAEFFPAVREAKLLKSTVVKEVHATFAPSPESAAARLQPQTAWPRVFLSGDWTATGWPATMEGAVRGGYLTAEALASAAGDARRFLVPDLPAQGIMRMFR